MTVQAERHAAEPASHEEALIIVHPLLRLDPPTDSSGKWTASWLGSRQGVRITGTGAAVLLLASVPVASAGIVDRLVLRGIAEATAWQLVQGLEQRGLLLIVSSPSYQDAWHLAQEFGAWRAAGWRAAAAYHFQTYGYPFETYGRDGSSDEDARRMLGYASTEADVDRGKDSADASSVRLPAPASGLAPFSFLDISAGRVPPAPFSLPAVAGLLSLVALPVQTVPLPWPGACPVVRKTSPSGGSRHPTEFYLRAIDVTGLPAGATIREVLVGERAEHEWAGSREFRGVLDGLLGGVAHERFSDGIDTAIGGLSGGERRRVALALRSHGPPHFSSSGPRQMAAQWGDEVSGAARHRSAARLTGSA